MDIGLNALDMVELNVELLAEEYVKAKEAAAIAKRQVDVLKKKLGQVMDLKNNDDLSTCNWKNPTPRRRRRLTITK